MPVLSLFDLNSGTWIGAVKSKRRTHNALLAWRMLRHLREGDIPIADLAFCSCAFIAACKARGADVVIRLHQGLDPQVEKGRRVGDNEWHVTWNRPLKAQQGCYLAKHKALHDALPATLDLRLVKVRTGSPGLRTQEVQIITTLRDRHLHSAAEIAEWYHAPLAGRTLLR